MTEAGSEPDRTAMAAGLLGKVSQNGNHQAAEKKKKQKNRTLALFRVGSRCGGGSVGRGALLLPVVAGARVRLPSLLPAVAISRSLRGSSGVCVGDRRR